VAGVREVREDADLARGELFDENRVEFDGRLVAHLVILLFDEGQSQTDYPFLLLRRRAGEQEVADACFGSESERSAHDYRHRRRGD
jgi:hypothetical protein